MKREDSPMQSLHLAAHVLYKYKKHHMLLFEKDRDSNVEWRRNPKTSEVPIRNCGGNTWQEQKIPQGVNKKYCPFRPIKNVEVVATGRK